MSKNFFIKIFGVLVGVLFLFSFQAALADQPNYFTRLKEMFTKVTIEKNDKAIPLYYDKDFEWYLHGKKKTYDEFLRLHQNIYKTPIQYRIRYDEKTLIEQGNKLAVRLFITTTQPNEAPQEIEVILIAEYKNSKLYRLWEMTYPDWTKMKTFEKIRV